MDGTGRRPTSRREFLKAAGGAVVAGCVGLGAGCGVVGRSLELSVEPSRARGDEPFVVRVSGLPPGERAVLSAAFDDALGQEWSAAVNFEADDRGEVDTSRQAPVEGSYAVRDPMGLVWSAVGPGPYSPAPQGSPVRLRARVGEEEASARVERFNLAGGVRAEDVREDGLVGRIFSPAGGGRVPGVLVLGGSEGGLSPYVEREAALLASRGYAALALAYFKGRYFEPEGAGDLPDTLTRVPLEYFGGALRWLGGRGRAQGDRLGVLGHSRGGELALLLGATYPEIKAVVSYVGSGVAASSPSGDEPAWTYRGKEVTRVPYARDPSSITREQVRRAEIPVEKTNGPVLLIAAGDDTLWPSERLSRVAMDRLERNDRPYDDELVVYPEAGHALSAPYVPTVTSASNLGGTAQANACANEDSWSKSLALLDRSL